MTLDKEKKQLIVIAVGLLVLLIVVMINLKPKKKALSKVKATTGGSATTVADSPFGPGGLPMIGGFPPPDQSVIKAQLQRMGTEQPWKDPFYPLVDKVSSKRGSLVLKGISWKQKGSSFAVINQEIVKVGDGIGSSKVVAIDKKSVTLEKDGQEYILVLEE